MTGPQVLERAHAFMTRHAARILTLILIYVAAASFYQAASRSFWFDEIFIVSIARLPTMADVWQALVSAADTSPPGTIDGKVKPDQSVRSSPTVRSCSKRSSL